MKYQRLIDIALLFYICLLTTKEIYAEHDYELVQVNTVIL